MMFMFPVFMLMLKNDLFCLLKKLVFISSFCSQVKIPLILWVGVGVGMVRGDLYIRHSEGMRNKVYKESESGDRKPFPQI